MTTYERINATAEANRRARRKQFPRRWWYRQWAKDWMIWIDDQPDPLRPTEADAMRNLRDQALRAEWKRMQDKIVRLRLHG